MGNKDIPENNKSTEKTPRRISSLGKNTKKLKRAHLEEVALTLLNLSNMSSNPSGRLGDLKIEFNESMDALSRHGIYLDFTWDELLEDVLLGGIGRVDVNPLTPPHPRDIRMTPLYGVDLGQGLHSGNVSSTVVRITPIHKSGATPRNVDDNDNGARDQFEGNRG